MRFTPPRLASAAALALAALVPSASRADTTWTEHYRAARATFAAGDLAAARHHLTRADVIVGGHANAIWNLALIAARIGERDEALRRLEEYAATGLARSARRDTSFAALAGDPRFEAVAARLDSNATPLARARVVADLGDPGLLAEDLARDPATRRTFVSSIHRRKIVVVERDGRVRDWIAPAADGVWGVYALRLDARRGLLWGTSAAGPVIEGYDAADSGRTAVLAWDLASARLVRRVELPRDGRPHVLGDMDVAPDGTVYVTDSMGGGLYRLRPGESRLDTLAASGTFGSPQSPIALPGSRRLLVADYPRGIASFDLGTLAVRWLPKPRTLAAAGFDGVQLAGDHLVAIQNGPVPHRVLWLALDENKRAITGWQVLEQASERLGEPNHGVIDGRRFVFIGDSGWDRVNARDQLETPAGARAPVLLELELPAR